MLYLSSHARAYARLTSPFKIQIAGCAFKVKHNFDHYSKMALFYTSLLQIFTVAKKMKQELMIYFNNKTLK